MLRSKDRLSEEAFAYEERISANVHDNRFLYTDFAYFVANATQTTATITAKRSITVTNQLHAFTVAAH